MYERQNPQLAIGQFIELLHKVPVPHKCRFPRLRLSADTPKRLNFRLILRLESLHPIVDLSQNVLLQRVRQIVRVAKVEASLVHLKLLEHIDVEVLLISIAVVCGHEERHHLCLGDLVETMLAYFAYSLLLGDHDCVETFQKANEAHQSIGLDNHSEVFIPRL